MKKWAKEENLTGEERWEKEEKERKFRERVVFRKEKWEVGLTSKVVEIIKKKNIKWLFNENSVYNR